MSFLTRNTDLLEAFITQRHRAYLWRKHGGPAPQIEVMRTYRFCNLKRDLDSGTIGLRKEYARIQRKSFLPVAVFIGRCVNDPEIYRNLVRCINQPIEPNWDAMYEMMNIRVNYGDGRVKGSAYITAPVGKGRTWQNYFALEAWPYFFQMHAVEKLCEFESLAEYAKWLTQAKSVGTFMAGQIIADLKPMVDWMQETPDYHSFAVPGPGSRRGVEHVAPGTKPVGWLAVVHEVRNMANFILRIEDATYRVDAQDAQNILCEFDKFMRVVNGQHYRRRL